MTVIKSILSRVSAEDTMGDVMAEVVMEDADADTVTRILRIQLVFKSISGEPGDAF